MLFNFGIVTDFRVEQLVPDPDRAEGLGKYIHWKTFYLIYEITTSEEKTFAHLRSQIENSKKNYIKGEEEKIIVEVLVLFTNPSARAGYDTRSIFKRSLTGLNSEFSFS